MRLSERYSQFLSHTNVQILIELGGYAKTEEQLHDVVDGDVAAGISELKEMGMVRGDWNYALTLRGIRFKEYVLEGMNMLE